jgi:hypothetical protein
MELMQMFIMSSSVLITIFIIWLSLGLFQSDPLLSESYNRIMENLPDVINGFLLISIVLAIILATLFLISTKSNENEARQGGNF